MAVVISAMAPNCTPSLSLHGLSRLSRASSGAMPPPALAQKDVPDTLFTDEEFQALMSGQCESFLSFSENDLQSPSPLVSLQLQAQLLCREDEGVRFQQETPAFALDDDDLEEPISDEEIERLAALFSDEEIQAIFDAPQQEPPMQFSSSPPRSTDDHAGKKRMSSPPWPSCIADDDDDDDEDAGPPPPPPPPPTKKARTTKTNSTTRSAPPPIKKKARTQTNRRSSPDPEHAAARAAELRRRLQKWHNRIANRILTRQFRAPELSRGRTALRCQCTELALAESGDERRGFGCCALHQDVMLPEDRAWMYSAQGQAPPLVGGPGEVLVPSVSAGCSKAMVRQYARWRRSVSLPTRFYVQRAVEKGLARLPDDDWTMSEY